MRVLVAIPCRDMMPVASAKSVAATVKAGYDVVFADGGGLPNARNGICHATISQGYDAVLMVDSDQVWTPEHVAEMIRTAERHPDVNILSGRYFARNTPHVPHAYINGHPIQGVAKKDFLQTVNYVGAGFLYITKKAIANIDAPWFDWSERQGEDAYFCHKATAAGF